MATATIVAVTFFVPRLVAVGAEIRQTLEILAVCVAPVTLELGVFADQLDRMGERSLSPSSSSAMTASARLYDTVRADVALLALFWRADLLLCVALDAA